MWITIKKPSSCSPNRTWMSLHIKPTPFLRHWIIAQTQHSSCITSTIVFGHLHPYWVSTWDGHHLGLVYRYMLECRMVLRILANHQTNSYLENLSRRCPIPNHNFEFSTSSNVISLARKLCTTLDENIAHASNMKKCPKHVFAKSSSNPCRSSTFVMSVTTLNLQYWLIDTMVDWSACFFFTRIVPISTKKKGKKIW